MNAFDEEMGPLASYHDLTLLVILAEAGLSLEEARAYMGVRERAVN